MTFKIEKGIPLPNTRGRKAHGEYAEVLGQLEIGDSFVAEGENMATLQSKVRQAAKRVGISVTASREGDTGVKLRVWRVTAVKAQPE